jgi:hypothetical protein
VIDVRVDIRQSNFSESSMPTSVPFEEVGGAVSAPANGLCCETALGRHRLDEVA